MRPMTKRAIHIKQMYKEEDWQGIVDSFFEKNPLGKESVEVCRLFVRALRRKGFFDEANLLEHNISGLLERAGLTHIARIAFCKEFNDSFDSSGLLEYFVSCLGKQHASAWVDFIKLLAKGASRQEFEVYQLKYGFSNNFVVYRKLFIAGFGRSGTGALRAFFNEFEEVFEVPGSEVTVISGRRGLSALFQSGDLSSFKERYLDFFALHALGVSDVNSHADNKELQKSKIILSSTSEIELLEAFFHLYFNVVFDGGFSCEVVEKASKEFLNRYVGSLVGRGCKDVVLFNNVVNAHKLWMMRLVDNYLCFPVSRDPRSQYASYVSTWRPGFSVDGFIRQLKKGEQLYSDGVRSLGERSENIIRVNFEDLVCHESERQRIAQLAGLDNRNASRFSLLKPEESMANVLLHASDDFLDRKKDFELIQEELGDYCMAPKA